MSKKPRKTTPESLAAPEAIEKDNPGTDWVNEIPIYMTVVVIIAAALLAGDMQPVSHLPLNFAVFLLPGFTLAILIRVIRLTRSEALIFAFLLIAHITLGAFTVSKHATFLRTLDLYSAAIVYAAFRFSLNGKKAAFVFAGALVIAGSAASVIGGNEYAHHFRAGDYSWRVFSTFFNPGYFSGFLVFSLFATAGLLMIVRERVLIIALFFGGLLQFGALALTGARAAILAVAAGGLVFALAGLIGNVAGRKAWERAAALLAAGILLAVMVGRPAASRINTVSEEGHSFLFRKYTWKASFDMAAARPLTGFGAGTYDIAIGPYLVAGYTRMAHSNYLQAAAEHGFPFAIAVFSYWFYVTYKAVFRIIRKKLAGESGVIALSLAAGVTACSVRGIFDSDWWCLPILLAASGSLGVLARLVTETGFSNQEPLSFMKEPREILLKFALAGSLAFLCFLSYRGYRAERLIQEALAISQFNDRADIIRYRNLWENAADLTPTAIQPILMLTQLDAEGLGPNGKASKEKILSRYAVLREMEPTNPRIPNVIGNLFMTSGNYREAEEVFLTAARLDPKSPRTLRNLASAQEALDKRSEALSTWREIIRLDNSPVGQVRAIPELVDPTAAWAYNALGDSYRQANPEEARRNWQKALDILTDFTESYNKMKALHEATGLINPQQVAEAENLKQKLTQKLAH